MSRTDEAKQIIEAVREGNFRITLHGGLRALERTLSNAEIQNIAHTLIEWKWQATKGTHLFIGWINANQGGGFVAKVENGVVIVTVFRRKLKAHQKARKS